MQGRVDLSAPKSLKKLFRGTQKVQSTLDLSVPKSLKNV